MRKTFAIRVAFAALLAAVGGLFLGNLRPFKTLYRQVLPEPLAGVFSRGTGAGELAASRLQLKVWFLETFSAPIKFYLENKFLVAAVFLVFAFGVAWRLARRRKKESPDSLYLICEDMMLTFVEVTDVPETTRENGKIVAKRDAANKVIYKRKTHYPSFDFSGLPSEFHIRRVHPKTVNNLVTFQAGLLQRLHEEGYIPVDSGSVSATGLPGEFKVELSKNSQIEEREMFKKIRWYREKTVNNIKQELFPKVEISPSEVVVDTEGLNITEETIRRGLELFSKHYGVKLKSNFIQDNQLFVFHYQTKLEPVFSYEDKEKISDDVDKWMEKIIRPMRGHYEKTGRELCLVGELLDPNISYATQIFWEIPNSTHFLVAGQTGSGKTKTVLSLILHLKTAFQENIEFFFADGKGSPDYDVFAEKFSDFPVAKPAQGSDPLVELANQVLKVWNIFQERRILFERLSKEGQSCSSITEYNRYVGRDKKIPRIALVIDEFAEFALQAPDKIENLITYDDTIFGMINRILRVGRSYGIMVVLASQRVQATDFPSPIRTNLTTRMIHAVPKEDANFLKMSGIVNNLSTGQYILEIPGMACKDSNNNRFKCSMPYVGDHPQELVSRLFPDSREHREFNTDLIYNTGREVDLRKADDGTVHKYVKQAFLVREGFEVVEALNPHHKILSLFAKKRIGDKEYKVAIGFLTPDEFFDPNLFDKIEEERPEDHYRWTNVFLVRGRVAKPGERLGDFYGRGNNVVFFEVDYVKKLTHACDLDKNDNDDEDVFTPMLVQSRQIEEDLLEIVDTDFRHDELNILELNRIRKMKNTAEKGDAFEAFYLKLERALGHDTVSARSLIESGVFKNFFASPRNEGGLDLCRWIDRNEKRAVLIQCKNQPSKALSTEVINKMIKTKELYASEGVKFEKLLLVASGKLTVMAKKEAARCKVGVIDGQKLDQILKKFNKTPKEAGEDLENIFK